MDAFVFNLIHGKKHCFGFEAILNSMLTPTRGSISGLTRLMMIFCTYVISGHLAFANEIRYDIYLLTAAG
jgi:hypothetical protein